nr:hypothetical protein [Rhodococcus erythropolis]
MLDVLVQPRRNALAVKSFFRRILKVWVCAAGDRYRQAG